jgi:two-component system cell cycle sensor histidine kinase/response regulator CckA
MDYQHRVLILDDDPESTKTLSVALSARGYVPIAVGQGRAALASVQAEMPAVALIDLPLEDMPGPQLVADIKQSCPGVECIMLTPHASQASAIEAVNRGAYSYLLKPYDLEQVLITIRTAIERREIEQALRESEDRYRDLVEHSHDLLCTHDLQGYILSVNRGAAELLGYQPDDLLNRNIRDLLAPEVRDEFDAYLATIRNQGVARGLMLIQTSTGEKRVWEYNNTLRTDGVAVPIVRGMAHDITERRRSEEQIKRRAENLAAVSQLAIKLADARPDTQLFELIAEELRSLTGALVTSISSYNATSQTLTVEYVALSSPILSRVNQLLGRNIIGLQMPVSPDMLKRLLSEVVGTAQDVSEMTFGVIPPPAGAAVQRALGIGRLTVLALYSGDELTGTIAIAEPKGRPPLSTDMLKAFAHVVTASLRRSQAEKVLRESEERYRTLVENVPIGIYRTTPSPEGRFLMANPAFLRMFGFKTQAELKHVSLGQLYANPDEGKAFSDDLLARGSVARVELQFKKKDGTLMWGSVTARVVYDEQAQGTAYFDCTIEDTSERKGVEERYYQSQKMQAIGQLTAGIAHDFNNLLTAVNGFTELMGVQLPPDDPLQEYVGQVLDSGQRAADLVSHLMAFARKQVLEPRVLDLNVVVAEMEVMLRRIIGEHIELKTVLAPDTWPVKVDAVRIEQVIVNLAVNARDAMPEGGRLTIETAKVVLDKGLVASHMGTKPGDYVLLAVSDTGVGMSPEVQAHIFEPFFTTKKRGGGTGLGLATVYGIVMQSGGDIQAYSEEGHGTTFKIYLPATQEAAQLLSRPQIEEKLPSGNETILLVEDDVGVRDLARLLLKEHGYHVLEARDGQQALRLAANYSGPIHLLLTDVVMPGMSGVAVAEQLAQTHPGLKTLFMSGYTGGAITYQNVLKPGAAFLPKLFSSLALTRKVREVLDAPRPAGQAPS